MSSVKTTILRQHWRRVRTTDYPVRINKELKRRSRVAGAYSNDQSHLSVAVCIMININEDWITGKGIYPWWGESNQDAGPLRIYIKDGTLPIWMR